MYNQTDAAKSRDAQDETSPTSPPTVTDGIVNLSEKPSPENAPHSAINLAFRGFRRLSLGTKATIFAIAFGTIPVLAIGTLAYQVASQSIVNRISEIQQSESKGLADKVNRFTMERYSDIQVLSGMPIFTYARLRENIDSAQKQVILNKFVDTYKVYDSITQLDLNGNVIASSRGVPVANQSSRDYFQNVRQKNSPVISQPQVSSTTKQSSIFILAPVKDSEKGNTVGVILASMPVQKIEEVVKNYTENDQKYYLIDASGKFFLATDKNKVGKDAKQYFPKLDRLDATKEDSFVTIEEIDNREDLVSYASKILQDLPALKWRVIVTTDTATAFEPQRQLLLTVALGTGLTALIVALLAAWLAKRATKPILQATQAVAKLGEGELDTRLDVESDDELGILSANINQMARQLQMLVKEQEVDAEGAKLLTNITLRIRRNLRTQDVCDTAVKEVRQALKTDRVVIYLFNQEIWDGSIIAESVSAGLPKMLGEQIDDPCFRERYIETYRDGRVRAIANIRQDPSLKNADCYIRMLEKYGVKANLVAPITISEQLVALMIAHNCHSSRNWQQAEIDLFKQLGTQVGYALEQAKLLEELEKAKNTAVKSTEEERYEKEVLQMQLLELLGEVEGAASGDLTVHAEVTAGEIGTVADFFNSIVENLRLIVISVKQAATQVNQAIGSNEGAIRNLASETLSQATEINHTLDAVDRMTQSMEAVAYSAQSAATVVQDASLTAIKSGKAMDLTVQNILHLRETVGETAKKVKRLGESTQQISRVVALINQISMQTNLLAINAGIEAARAGEEGQGFAVVAEEVGELAARSAAATKEIEQIVENIQRETSEVVIAMELGTTQVVEGTRIVEDAKQNLNQILEVSRQIDSLVQSISNATTSQVETSQTVSSLMKEIAATSQRTLHSSTTVSESLQQTVEISKQLQASVDTFKVN
ncbi:MAG: methyl-accepting chemotaxis protein [Rhizonema sp. NSF051]|nr:methyl-accepting chemotaxis protein [Rhizonema sp. NSF051]